MSPPHETCDRYKRSHDAFKDPSISPTIDNRHIYYGIDSASTSSFEATYLSIAPQTNFYLWISWISILLTLLIKFKKNVHLENNIFFANGMIKSLISICTLQATNNDGISNAS